MTAPSPAAGMAELVATIRNSPSCAAVRHRQIADELERLAAEVAELRAPRDLVAPKSRDVGRYGDMSPSIFMRVGLDNDNDAYLGIYGDENGEGVEFCTQGMGGGKSPRTRDALIALMVAMEADNADDPSRDFWRRRLGDEPPVAEREE